MPIIRVDAAGDVPCVNGQGDGLSRALAQADARGPVVVMLHGYKYRPDSPGDCPHRQLYALPDRERGPVGRHGWPAALGLGPGQRDDALVIAFGWNARGTPRAAMRRAATTGHALARTITQVNRYCPGRPVQVLAHSMGTEPVFEALHHLPPGAVGRIVAMTGASYLSRAHAALATAAGQTTELINITSRENDLFDFIFERLVPAPRPDDRAIGHGLALPNAITLQLDCARTLTHLAGLGARIGPPERRICHWSAYRRPGAMPFYARLMREPERWPLARLVAGVPDRPDPRWSRLVARPEWGPGLPPVQNPS